MESSIENGLKDSKSSKYSKNVLRNDENAKWSRAK